MFGSPIIADPSFETPYLGTGGATEFVYNPTGTGWTFTYNTGIANQNSGFEANIGAPDGTQFAFMQSGIPGTISQTVTGFTVGASYTLSFFDSARLSSTPGSFTVTMGSSNLGSFTPAGDTFLQVTTSSFTASSASELLTFTQTYNNPDEDELIDLVQINQTSASTPEPGSIALLFGGMAALGGFGLFARRGVA
jgi:hypothetical protein